MPLSARADINGFGDFSGFTLNQGDAGTPPAVSANSLQVTSGPSQYRSIFFNTPQSVGSFSASFDYRAPGGVRYLGVTFVLQNAAAGVHALGSTALGSFGYQGVTNSVGVTLQNEFDGNTTRTGIFSGGVLGGGALATDPVHLYSGSTIHVTLTYNGTLLTETLHDLGSGNVFSTSALLNIPGLVGGATALVGLTADGGSGVGSHDQFISDLRFGAVPAPSSLAIVTAGAVLVQRRRRE
jgi:hypothetical protein